MTYSVKPDPDYKRSFFDRHGAEASDLLNVFRWLPLFSIAGGGIGVALAERNHLTLAGEVFAGIDGVVLASAASALFQLGMSRGIGKGFETFIQPGGEYKRDYSQQDALLAKGDVDGAIESYRQIIGEQPEDLDARLRAAELLAKKGDREAAAALYREIQSQTVKKSEDVRASYRLIDLYLGWPGREGRALRELRRLIDLYPDSDVAREAKKALTRLKPGIVAAAE